MTKNLVFVDSRVADYQTLVAGLRADTAWVLIDADKDGVLQMQSAVANYSELDSIHIISHGSSGTLYLGSTVLNGNNLSAYASQFQAIGAGLTANGDILLYGCNVAQGGGINFINSLATITRAEVAASDDATGSVISGGNDQLEAETGEIEASTLAMNRLIETLAVNTAPTFTFSDGRVTTDFGGSDGAKSVIVQSDGKILMAGYGVSKFALARYNTNGSLDTSFDTDGKVTTDMGTNSAGYGATIQSDGKILVAGYYGGLARYNTNGSLDTNFGTDGKVTAYLGGMVCSPTVQSDGKILVAGGSDGDFALARYNTNGSLDTSFGSDGKVTTDFGTYGGGESVTVQSDGKILVAGGSDGDFALARYNTNGSLDTSFDTDGKVTTDFGGGDPGFSVTVQSDGKILVAGGSDVGFALARYNTNGSLDTSFDTDGKVTTDFGGIARSVTVQSDGKILVTGNSGDDRFVLARYNTNGSLDTSFDSDGKVTTDFWVNDISFSVTVQSDGKILVAGRSDDNFALARYNTNGSLDTSFSPPENTLQERGPANYAESWSGYNVTPVALAPTAQILDAEQSATGHYGGATLNLARQGGANAQDVFSGLGTLSALNQNSYFSVDAVTIGRVNTNGNGALSLTFNSNATQTLVNNALQQIGYANTSDAPPASVQINWTFNDGNTGTQGTGGALGVTGSSTVNITATNDAPIYAYNLTNQTVASGVQFSYTLPANAFSDPDLEPLTYSVSLTDGSAVPPWLSINPSNGTLSGTPDAWDVGTFDVALAARDSSGFRVSAGFQLAVSTPSQVIDGTTGNDNLLGQGGDDVLNGLAGNDTLDGGAGNDNLLGGAGSDTYYVRDAADTVTETDATAAGGTDQLYLYLSAYTMTDNLENARIMIGTPADLTGNGLNNLLYAGAGDNLLDAQGGIDTLAYTYASVAITASLATSIAQETGGSGVDTLRNIENLTGSNFDDTLTGNRGANTLNGGKGADVMQGLDGSDVYYVDNDDDIVAETNMLEATGGTDIVCSYLTAYTLGRNVENGRILTSAAANLTGNSLNNVLYAGAGNNVLNGNTGTDTVSYLYGLTGTTGVTVSLAVSTAQVTIGSSSDTLIAIENLTGSAYADTLTGNTGNNILDGGSGNDTLTGGLGNDTYVINTTSDIVTELAGQGTDLIQTTVSYSLFDTDASGANGGNVENLQLLGTGNLNATGNSLNNVIYANSGVNSIDGGAGTDTVSFQYLTTTGSTGVTLNLSVFNATTLQSTASGISGADLIKNIENITGSNYADTLTGNAGSNVLNGGGGNDTMTGGAGNDTYYVSQAGDVVSELAGGGTDTVSYLGFGAAVTANLTTIGLANIEHLVGSNYADSLTGNTGNNVLTGGLGKDTLFGNGGNDTFDFNALTEMGTTSASWDVITDFNLGDKVDLSTLDANTVSTTTNEAFAYLGSAAFTAAGQLRYDATAKVLYGNTDANLTTSEFAIQLTGVSSLSSADFVL